MKNFALRLTAVAALAALASPAFAAFDANIEFDNTWLNDRKFDDGDGGTTKVKRGIEQSGRVELNASGKAGPDVFIAGRASFLAKKDGSVATDDMWVQVGNASADLKLGRFEAADLFPLPRDVLVLYADGGDSSVGNTVYRTNALRGRTGGNLFHAAGTFNAGGGLSVELGLIETKNTADGTLKGLRPVVAYANGPLTVRGGVELIRWADGAEFNKATGFGLTAGYNLGGVTLTGNYANLKVDDGGVDLKTNTLGLIASADMGLTGGVILYKAKVPGASDYKITTFYAAYAIPFFGIKGATVSPAISVSNASGSNNNPDERGVRVRFNYAF
jgi:Porin-like glycoporin RafY